MLTVAACDHDVCVSQVRARLRELVCGMWPWARVAVSQDEAAAAAEKERAAAGKVLIVNLAMAPASSGGSQAAAMAGAARLTSKVLLDALLQPGAPEPETEAEVCATEA
eukprot:COSAG01_NODE_6515_length_3625_cov_10.649461_2_plen_109_part_00